MPLIVVGYWSGTDPDEVSLFIDPRVIVREISVGERIKIVRYLDSGHVASEYMGYSYCRFRCGVSDEEMGNQSLSDGTFVWPKGLSHYVHKHSIALPQFFIRAMAANNFKVPTQVSQASLEGEQNTELWQKWCEEQSAGRSKR